MADRRSATLDNGLKVLVQEEHTAPLASVWCWYKVGSKDERPGLTGVSHWVEHMNFKGTTNIPRDQVKGIIEQFGGSWNGYTWIDQTTYLETATRDALDRMLFIESERMASCLYHPDDCESERTVIISELQGGENDPDQLLDQELTATAFKAHPYRHPTIGWLSDLQTMTPRRPVRLLPPLLRPQQRDARHRRRRRHRRGAAARRAPLRRHPAGRRPRRGCARVEPEQTGERRLTIRREGTTAYLKVGYHAPAVDRPAFLPAARPRRGADRREGPEPVVQFPRAAAAAQRAAVSRARRARPRLVGVGRAAADRAAVSLHGLGDRDRRHAARRRWNRRCSTSSTACAREGITDAELARGQGAAAARGSCSTTTASRTSRISSATSRPSRASTCSRALPARIAAVTLDEVGRRRARGAARRRTAPSAGSSRCLIGTTLKPQVRSLRSSSLTTQTSAPV